MKLLRKGIIMKRFLLILTVVLTAFSCFACGDGGSIDVNAEANAIIEKYGLSGGTLFSHNGQVFDDDLIRSYYGDASSMPDFGIVEEYAVYIDETKPLTLCEFGIFKLKDGANAEEFTAYLKARINMKLQNAVAYPNMDTEPLSTAKFTVVGNNVWYCAVKGANEEIDNKLKEILG